MFKSIYKIFIFLLTLSSVCVLYSSQAYAGRLSEFKILCGVDSQGNSINCNMTTHVCLQCTESSRGGFLWAVKTTKTTYRCVTANTKMEGCTDTSGRGGTTGDITKTYAGVIEDQTQEGYNCIVDNLIAQYESVCYSCIIVETLISAFIKAGSVAYDVSRQAANVILIIATILWLAMYVLKNVSSFTAVEPMKMLQDIFIQLFKVMVAFVVVNAGISTILDYTMVPIITAGTDLGTAIIDVLGK